MMATTLDLSGWTVLQTKEERRALERENERKGEAKIKAEKTEALRMKSAKKRSLVQAEKKVAADAKKFQQAVEALTIQEVQRSAAAANKQIKFERQLELARRADCAMPPKRKYKKKIKVEPNAQADGVVKRKGIKRKAEGLSERVPLVCTSASTTTIATTGDHLEDARLMPRHLDLSVTNCNMNSACAALKFEFDAHSVRDWYL
jgi:hypothetical protein